MIRQNYSEGTNEKELVLLQVFRADAHRSKQVRMRCRRKKGLHNGSGGKRYARHLRTSMNVGFLDEEKLTSGRTCSPSFSTSGWNAMFSFVSLAH